MDSIMVNTTCNLADNGYFRGGGYSSRFETKAEMPCTMIRLNLVKGLVPVLQIAEYYVNYLGVRDTVENIVSKIQSRLLYEYSNNIFTKPYVKEYLRMQENIFEKNQLKEGK